MRGRGCRRHGLAWAPCVALLLLSSCAPWTVRPIGSAESGAGQDHPFDAAAYVESIWGAKLLPAVSAHAVDLAEFLKAYRADPSAAVRRYTTGRSLLVKGRGRVIRLDSASPRGRLLVDVAPYDGRADAAIEIGPVIGGTVLRDALPFIQFSQFVNQLQFAAVGNALNDRVANTVLAPVRGGAPAGSVVSFSGASTLPTADAIPDIVPVAIEVGRGRS